MPVDVQVVGADQLGAIADELKRTGNTELRRDLYRGIQRSTKPLRQDVQQAARDKLPRRGKLNEWVAESKFSTRTRGGKNPGVRITSGKRGHDMRAIDRGRLRHPVFGNKKVWVTQQVTPGWFSQTLADGAPAVRRELVKVLEDVAERIARSG